LLSTFAWQKAIYDGIRKREIIMPEEHTGQLGFDYAWNELLRRARSAGSFLICPSSEFDKAIFTLAWKPVISALSYAFTHFTDDYMLQRAIAGFQQCASLANKFGLPEVFDYTIRSLSKITGLCSSQLTTDPSANFPTIDIDGQTISVSPLALRFGTSFKAQLAAVVLFSIANDNTASISMSWLDVRLPLHTVG
jgi:brefeldin A-resistance guanine nucleotide exchange factor 1